VPGSAYDTANEAAAGTAHAAAYWSVPLLRAIPAVLLAGAVTFLQDHSVTVGLTGFGSYAALSGAIIVVMSARLLWPGVSRRFFIAQGSITVAAGVVALIFSDGGLPFFLFLLSAWAAVTGFLELFSGLRSRGRSVLARDWVFVGALTALFSVVVLLVPPDLQQQFTGPDGVERVLTASVIVVGALGAYCAVIGIYLVIAGLSLKWSTAAVELDPMTESGSRT